MNEIPQDLPDMVAVKDADFSNVDAVFCCLPHGTTQVSFDLFITSSSLFSWN